jgi:hypothetical protein
MQRVRPLLAALATLAVGAACDRLPTAPRPLDAATAPAPAAGRVGAARHPLGLPNDSVSRDPTPVDFRTPSPPVKTSPSVTLGCPTCQPSPWSRRAARLDEGDDLGRRSSGAQQATHTLRGREARFSNYAVAW